MKRLDDEVLNAYADGELEVGERDRVAAALAQDPDARERLLLIRQVSLLGSTAVDQLSREPVPGAVRELVWPLNAAEKPATKVSAWGSLAAAAVAFLALGLGIGNWLATPAKAPAERLAALPVSWDQQAAWYHGLATDRESRLQPLPLDLEHSREAPLETSLAQRLERPIVVPDLSSEGLVLLGARLLGDQVRPLAQVFYRDPEERLVSLLLALDPRPDAAPIFRRLEDTPLLSWREAGQAFVLAGDGDGEQLRRLAILVRAQVGPGSSGKGWQR